MDPIEEDPHQTPANAYEPSTLHSNAVTTVYDINVELVAASNARYCRGKAQQEQQSRARPTFTLGMRGKREVDIW